MNLTHYFYSSWDGRNQGRVPSRTGNAAANIIQGSSSLWERTHSSASLPQDIRRHKACHRSIFCLMLNEKKIVQPLTHKGLWRKIYLLKTCYYFHLEIAPCVYWSIFQLWFIDIFSLQRKLLVILAKLKCFLVRNRNIIVTNFHILFLKHI